MIVCKFGGSSLADARQIKKACGIMLENEERRIMVVSAPGIRPYLIPDRKVTDLLFDLAHGRENGLEARAEQEIIRGRFKAIGQGLGLPEDEIGDLLADFDLLISRMDARDPSSRADLLAFGEVATARLVTAYFQSIGILARFVDPREAGLLLSHRQGITEILPETYDKLAPLALESSLVIFPGFFGTSLEGRTILFSRGGSDITGAVLAAAVKARVYENWTDQNNVLAVNPELIPDALPLEEMSYREMRELAYIGFSIIHPEALEPVFLNKIPVHIRNTNDRESPGTRILAERTHIERVLTGIAAADPFCTINIRRILINREIGILGKILTIFAELGINVHHVPTGIVSGSGVVKEEHFPLEQELVLRQRLQSELGFDQVTVVRQLTLVMLVGEGMRDTVGVMARAAGALAKEQISVEVVMLDYFEISMLFVIRQYEKLRAVSALYNEFFPPHPPLV